MSDFDFTAPLGGDPGYDEQIVDPGDLYHDVGWNVTPSMEPGTSFGDVSDTAPYDWGMSPDTAELYTTVNNIVDQPLAGEPSDLSQEPADAGGFDVSGSDMTPSTASLVGNLNTMFYDINHEDLSRFTPEQLRQYTDAYVGEARGDEILEKGLQIQNRIGIDIDEQNGGAGGPDDGWMY